MAVKTVPMKLTESLILFQC